MRVFVTVGNATASFDRLLRIVDEALRMVGPAVQGVSQGGVSRIVPQGLTNRPYLSRTEFEYEMAAADVVISHAGVGTIRAALRKGHCPFVLPRRGALGEHVNDHQQEVFEALLGEGMIRPVEDAAALAGAMGDARRGRPLPDPSPRAIGEVLQEFSGPAQTRLLAWPVLWILSLGRDARALEIGAPGGKGHA